MISLRRRLTWGLATILVLIFAAHWLAADWVIRYVAENQMTTRLEHDGDALLSSLTVDDAGRVRFNTDHVGLIYGQAFSGHYFVIQSDGQEFRSDSMGEERLTPRPVAAGQYCRYHAQGPKAQPVLVLTRGLTRHDHLVSLTVAEDLTEIGREIALLRLGYLALTIVVLLVAIGLQSQDVRRALRPLVAIREDLRLIGRGQKAQIEAQAPREIQPLVVEINRLLMLVERRLQQSRTALGNLAHALKTPLSILFRAASDPAVADHPQLSRQLQEQTQTIHTRIERELKRARLSGNHQSVAGFNPRTELESLVALLQTLYGDQHLTIDLSAPDCLLPYDRQDMLELIGNLADNACKWAHTRVLIEVDCPPGRFTVTVADDGPGCSEEELPNLTQRGVRLDEAQPGHGLGLAIARDIVDFYGGKLELGRSSQLGGLVVTLHFSA